PVQVAAELAQQALADAEATPHLVLRHARAVLCEAVHDRALDAAQRGRKLVSLDEVQEHRRHGSADSKEGRSTPAVKRRGSQAGRLELVVGHGARVAPDLIGTAERWLVD